MSEIIKKAASNEVVQLLYNDLRQRQENIPSAENIVMVQDQQPTVPANKVWLTETPPAGVEVPTYGEFTGVIAPDYADLDFPVSAGEHCIHNGVLYTAKQNINSSEVWTAAHWEAGSVSSKLTEISNDIQGMSASEPLANIFTPQDMANVLDGYILKRGVPQTQYGSGYVVTDYIPVTGGDALNLNFVPWGSADNIYRCAEYNANKEYIGYIASFPVTLNQNTAYIRFSVQKSLYGSTAETVIAYLNRNFVITNGSKVDFSELDNEENTFESQKITRKPDGFFVDASGYEMLILSKMQGANNKDVGVKMKTFGSNASFQFSSFGTIANKAPFVSNKPLDYVQFMETGEDFFGPIVAYAINNIDGDDPSNAHFTGGMHKFNSKNTARLISIDIYYDGRKCPGFVGYCDTIDMVITYNLQVANTVKNDGTGREVVKQITKLHFEKGVIYTETSFIALEPVNIQTFYFMQGNHKANGMGANGIRYIGSEANRGINSMDVTSDSGDLYCRTMRMLSDVIQMDLTIDDVDLGRFAHVTGNNPVSAYVNTYTNYSKCYFNAIRSNDNMVHLDTGASCVAKGSIRLGIFE